MSKKKTPSKETKEPDPKDQFKDWLKESWLNTGDEKSLFMRTEVQKKIVAKNVNLLVDREAWKNRVKLFETTVPANERSKYFIHFDGANISHCRFSDLRFPCSISFHNAVFEGNIVSFSEAEFGGDVINFQSSRFEADSVLFTDCKFGNGDVQFNYADFGCADVFFPAAEFGECKVSFDYCKLGGRFHFQGDPRQSNSIILGPFFMRNVRFPDAFSLTGRQFVQAPNFIGSTFKLPPDLSEVRVGPPIMEGDWWRPKSFKRAKRHGDAARYRKLKAMAIASSDHEKELEFFAHELRCKRGHETKGWASFLNSLYELTSNYGQSIWRPAKGLAVVSGLFLALYILWIGVNWPDAIIVTLYNGLPFLKAFGGV